MNKYPSNIIICVNQIYNKEIYILFLSHILLYTIYKVILKWNTLQLCQKPHSFLVLLVCAVMLGLLADFSFSAVGHICAMWQVYLFGGICQ